MTSTNVLLVNAGYSSDVDETTWGGGRSKTDLAGYELVAGLAFRSSGRRCIVPVAQTVTNTDQHIYEALRVRTGRSRARW